MASKAAEKIIGGLTELLQGFNELQEELQNQLGEGAPEIVEDDTQEEESNPEVEAQLVNEVRNSLEAVIDAEDCSPTDVAGLISALTEALEEIDPEIFDEQSGEDEEEEEEYEDLSDIEDIDDDLDLDDEELEEEEDEDEDLEEADDEDEDVEEEDDEDEKPSKKKSKKKR